MIGYLWYGTMDIVTAKVLFSATHDANDVFQDVLYAHALYYCSVGDTDIDEEAKLKGKIMIEEYKKVIPEEVMNLLDRGTFRLKISLYGAVRDPDHLATKWKAMDTVRKHREAREYRQKNGGVNYAVYKPRARKNRQENREVREEVHQVEQVTGEDEREQAREEEVEVEHNNEHKEEHVGKDEEERVNKYVEELFAD